MPKRKPFPGKGPKRILDPAVKRSEDAISSKNLRKRVYQKMRYQNLSEQRLELQNIRLFKAYR